MSGNGVMLQLDAVEEMCISANKQDLTEVIEDYDDICELLQTGSICKRIGTEKIYITLAFEKAPDDAEVFGDE